MDTQIKLTAATIKTLIFLIFGSLVLMSCSDKIEDTGPTPVVQLIEPGTDAPLSNIVKIKGELVPDVGLTNINLEVDGVSDTSFIASVIDFEWDSRKKTDGTHNFKLIVETNDGQIIEFPFQREIRNTLFDLTVSNKYVEAGTTRFILINDESGKLITHIQLQNGLNIPILVPMTHQWNESRYSVTLFSYDSYFEPLYNQTFYSTNLQTFTEVEPGSLFLDRQIPQSVSVKGNHKLMLTNAPLVYNDMGVFGKGVNSYFAVRLSSSLLSISIPMVNNTSDLTYFMVIGDSHKYLKKPGSEIGITSTAFFTEFQEMENAREYLFQEPLRYRYFIFGVNDQQYKDRTAIANRSIPTAFPASDKLTIKYPTESYDQYITSISVIGASRADYFHTIGESVPADFKYWDGSFIEARIEDVKLSTKLTKEATMAHVWLGSTVETATTYDSKSWHFYLPGDTQYSIGLPQLPLMFSGLFPEIFQSGYTFEAGEVVEIVGDENTYRDFTRQFLNEGNERRIYGDYLFGNNSAMMLASIPISNSGGRKRTSFKPTHLSWEPPDNE